MKSYDDILYQETKVHHKMEAHPKMASEVKLVEIGNFMTLQEATALEVLLKENDIPFVRKSEDMGGYYGISSPVMHGVHIFISDEDMPRFEALDQ